MNFLAHLYLSGSDPDIRLGNFIGDFVKGKQYLNYPEPIQSGILLHRTIDAFTDSHPVVHQSMQHFREQYRRYSGVVTDLVYDHFLAANWHRYSPQSLADFVAEINRMLMRNYFKLPNEVKGFLPFLVRSRRLETYQTLGGIERSLTIMTNHSSLPHHVAFAMQQLEQHYSELQDEFFSFFEDVRLMAEEERRKM
jgi:acyl carrier protein phosphodiesterase